MINQIKALCKKNNITVQWLALHFGWGANSINRWDDNKPSIDKVAQVADFFNVSIDYIYGNARDVLNADEIQIIKKARNLDKNGLETVLYIIDSELRRMNEITSERQKSADIIPLWRSLQPASAGRGFYLSADEFETIIVRKTDETKQAAFCVPVSGNSMEDKYHDGDILLVGRKKTLQIGQIGIFTVDGKGYVKQLNEGYLVSLNADYPPIPITENTLCHGNVIGTLDKDLII